jgi:hypothetical protein
MLEINKWACPTSISMDSNPPLVAPVVNSSPSFSSTPTPTNKGKTKGGYLQQYSQNIESMASTMEVDSKQHLVLMHAHMQITIGKTNKVKINNLKIARKLGVISEEEFKAKIKQILDL